MDAQVYAEEIVRRLVRSGYKAYYAGGWVRDYLMGNPSDDIDIATDAPPEQILNLFPKTILIGLAFGIVIVVMDGHQFEVATFRRDIGTLDGRKPERIELSSEKEDALRRDFTINGMFYDPLSKEIYDYVQGKRDLKLKVIRTIGDPQERFLEDRLRMVRAVRFSARFEFPIDPDTQQAIIENADALFPSVAMERLWQELNKMSSYPHFDKAIIDLHRLGLLPVIFPEVKGVHLNEIKKRVAFFPLYPEKCPAILYLLALFPRASPKEVTDLCQYMKISMKELKLALLFLEAKKMHESADISDWHWAHFYANSDSDLCVQILASSLPIAEKKAFITNYEARKEKLQLHIDRIVAKKPLVNAEILRREKILPGKTMGILLREAEKIAIENNFNNLEEVVQRLKKNSFWPKEVG